MNIDLLIRYLYNPYVRATVIFLIFFLFSKLVVWISEKVLLRFASRTKNNADERIIRSVNGPISLILIFFGLKIGLSTLDFSATAQLYIGRVLNSFVIVIGVYIVVSVLNILLDVFGKSFARKTHSSLDDNLLDLGHKVIKVLFFVVIFLMVLSEWGVAIGPFLASLGIAGIAVAFALQNTLGNIFGGISLILDRSIKVGDIVSLDADTKGSVLDIGLRATRLRTFDNELIVIPNGKLADMKIQNIVQPDPMARVVVPFSVAYGSDVGKVKRLILPLVKKIDGSLADPAPIVRFSEMADSSLKFVLYFHVDHYSKKWAAKDEMNTLVYNTLNKNKISIPFPQMDVHLKK